MISKLILKINHIVFWWYYKRVPEFFHQWPMLKSVNLLRQNYESALFREKGLNEVISVAIKRESEMQSKISNLELRAMGISQDVIDPINKMFGTNLKGKSNEEKDN